MQDLTYVYADYGNFLNSIAHDDENSKLGGIKLNLARKFISLFALILELIFLVYFVARCLGIGFVSRAKRVPSEWRVFIV